MTFYILAEVAQFSLDGEFLDIEHDIHEIEASDEMSARQALAMLINGPGRRIGRMFIESSCQANLSDSLY